MSEVHGFTCDSCAEFINGRITDMWGVMEQPEGWLTYSKDVRPTYHLCPSCTKDKGL